MKVYLAQTIHLSVNLHIFQWMGKWSREIFLTSITQLVYGRDNNCFHSLSFPRYNHRTSTLTCLMCPPLLDSNTNFRKRKDWDYLLIFWIIIKDSNKINNVHFQFIVWMYQQLLLVYPSGNLSLQNMQEERHCKAWISKAQLKEEMNYKQCLCFPCGIFKYLHLMGRNQVRLFLL